MASKKAYVLVPINWEYNDEYYDEQGYETPSKAYTDLDKAKTECRRLSAIEARNFGNINGIKSGGYEGDKDKAWFEALGAKVDGELGDYCEIEVNASVSDENIAQILKELDLVFVEIRAVVLEE